MQKRILPLAVAIMAVCVMVVLSGCTMFKLRITSRTPTEYQYAVDDNLAISSTDEQLLNNPDRGFRGECYITLGSEVAYPSSQDDPYLQYEQELSYQDANIQVVQTYVYLIEYYNRDLDDKAFAQLKKYFEMIDNSGAKSLLRFAYEYTSTMKEGPTTKQIVRHCEQLKQFFQENIEMVYRTVYSMQLGMIGLWGEGHGNQKPHNVKKIIKAVADMTPEGINIMIRTPQMLSKVPANLRSRYTLHDDFLVGFDHEWGMLSFKHPQYSAICNIARKSISDGEMPWGTYDEVESIDSKLFLEQIARYGLTTLSLKHNYMEVEEHQNYELYKWKSVYISKAQLEDSGLPYNPKMLQNGRMTIFEYINYHLGYQIAASNYLAAGGNLSFMLTNYGMAAPLGYDMQVIVDGVVVKTLSAEQMELYQFSQYKVKLKVDKEITSSTTIGIKWVSGRDGLTFKMTNDVPYIDGINYIKGR